MAKHGGGQPKVGWIDHGDGTVSRGRGGKPGPKPVPRAVREWAFAPQAFGTYKGSFGRVEAKRLLDRAGFGPKPGQAERLAKLGMRKAVYSLTRPLGAEGFLGPEPHDADGNPLDPLNAWGHTHLAWLDRMVRTTQPLVERLALVFHDWFATSDDKVDQRDLLLNQIELFRTMGRGSFLDLFTAVTKDPAMLIWLDGIYNTRRNPNENYAREMQELFSLGADRGAYSEDDVRELAKCLTGWRADWVEDVGYVNFRFDSRRFDSSSKTVFGQSGVFGTDDAVRMCVAHPLHPSFFVSKLWSYFVASPPSQDTLDALSSLYSGSSYQIQPVLEAILMHPDFYRGPRMVKPPVVYAASLLRAAKIGIETDAWTWLCEGAGQLLFRPPNVSGWDDTRWLDTSSTRARWHFATYIDENRALDPWDEDHPYRPVDEEPAAAFNRALEYWGWPPLTDHHRKVVYSFSSRVVPKRLEEWERSPRRAMRQNALRHLIANSPDLMLM